jgi:hypothetical protein
LEEEATIANNSAGKKVKIVDEKIKVLYIEGKPRWEYRYLRRVLLRDRRLDVKFLMTQGDRELAEHSDLYLNEYPADPKQANEFDLVILGDVPRTFFMNNQLARIEEFVTKRRGSFLMIAGSQHAPGGYAGTPIERLLPVKPSREGCREVDAAVAPRVTQAGARSAITTLAAADNENRAAWARVTPMFRLPALQSVKKGATVLVDAEFFLPGIEAYPVVSWQRYGNGKSMFVATDQL